MCSGTLPLVTAELRYMVSSLIFLFVFLLPPLHLHACISSGQLLQFSFERLPLLIAPSVDPHLNSARHCDAQVDASCGRKHKQAEK